VCQRELKSGSRDKEGEAHKLLADVHAKNGNVQMAIHHLGELMNIAEAENKTQAQADAALKLGLLHYQEQLIQKSVSYFQKHFELTRKDESASKS
jgi:tetratricopeptide (TPR) repeat protein